jgi:preprotein translocase subunit SecD
VLAVLILIMLITITGKDTFSPGKWHQQFKIGLGLDLSSGTQVVLQAQTPKNQPPSSAEMNQAISILNARVNGTGNTGAQVQQQGSNLISVSIPGKGTQATINLVSSTAKMSFRQALLFAPYTAHSSAKSKAASYGDPSEVSAATMKLFNELVCTPGKNGNVNDNWKSSVGYSPQLHQWDDPSSQIVSCDAGGDKYVLGKAIFQGTDVTAVNAGLQQNSSQWVVDMTLDGTAAKAFGNLTTMQYSNYYASSNSNEDDLVLDQTAMVLDGDTVSAPETQAAIPNGQVQISGGSNGFTQQQATQLTDELKYGALPLSFTQLYVTSISAQLGKSSLNAGLISAAIGLALVVLYSFLYYRGLSVVSISSLLLASLIAYLTVVLLSRYQNFTLSLAGIAGLVVAVGITADSFIVFFARLRDEVQEGKALRPAVESGWKRARRTILVSDTVSFLCAVLLYHFAVSDVQGFAYTLGLTVLINVLVVFLYTKPLITLLARTKFYGGGHRWSGLDPQRLGARAPWRPSVRRTQRTAAASRSSASSSATREA